jgi:hypothetical protein
VTAIAADATASKRDDTSSEGRRDRRIDGSASGVEHLLPNLCSFRLSNHEALAVRSLAPYHRRTVHCSADDGAASHTEEITSAIHRPILASAVCLTAPILRTWRIVTRASGREGFGSGC